MHLFSHPPTMGDICKLVGHLDLSSHVVSIRMATHDFSTRVPRFLNEATGWSPVPVLFDQSVPVRDLPKEYSA